MSESAKVRLVRCPKCENLLPELTDYSVYQCGGCGAVLRANNKNGELDEFVDKSEEEVVVKPENVDVSEKRMMNVSDDGSGYDVKSNISSLSRAERRRASLMNESDDWGTVDERVVYKNEVDEQGRENMAKEFENFDSRNGKEMETRIPGRVLEWRSRERSESDVLPRARRVDLEGMRYSSSINPEEGPSGYCSSSNYDYDKPSSRNDVDAFNQVDYPVDDRAELLRKFNELKEQLSRLDNVSEKPKETVSLERRMDRHEGYANLSENSKGTVSLERRMAHHEGYGNLSENPNGTVSLERRMARHEGYGNSYDWFPEGSTRIMNRASAQNPVSDDRPLNLNRYNMSTPSMNGNDMLGGGFYPPRSHIQEYGGPLRSQVLRRDPYQAPAPFQQQPSHAHFPGRYMDNETPPADPYRSYPPQINPHHPSCNCYHCCNADQILSRAPPTAFGDKRFSVIPQNPMFYHHENTGSFGQRDYNPRNANTLPLKPQSSQLQMGRSGDLNSDVGGYARRRPPRVQLSGQQCRPVAGGAPFFTCYNCFELLQLPKNVLHKGKKQKKMKCGACSTVMVFSVAGNKLAVSIDERLEKISDKIGQQHRVILNEGNLYTDGHTNHPSMTFSSEDYDTARYDFHAMDQELGSLSTGHGSSIKSADLRSLRSTHSCSSREEDNLVNSTARMEKSNSAELPMKGKSSPPPAGSPLQEYFDYSSKYHVENRLDNGNRSARSDSEKLMQKKTTSRQTSTKGVAVATEMDIPSNEYANTGTSFESGESSKDGDSLKSSKAGESFFAGIIKKSFKEFSRSNSTEQEKANTTVNGHLVPNRLIKKAEKISGPIQPGQYWYDFRAGFWGMMGGPCLGIIPPFIEEFNYPLPENCAGGNTGVFVNGRELHPKDLKLLGSRGLPTERDRSYIIEISGRVLDEDTGEELESLGKLAPTVEKSKRGFGMKVPKVAAQPA